MSRSPWQWPWMLFQYRWSQRSEKLACISYSATIMLCCVSWRKQRATWTAVPAPSSKLLPRPAPHFILTMMSLGRSYPIVCFGSAVLGVAPPSFLWKLALSQATAVCMVTPNVCCREVMVGLLSDITTGCLLIWKKMYRWREDEEGCWLSELLIRHRAKISFCVLWCSFLFLTGTLNTKIMGREKIGPVLWFLTVFHNYGNMFQGPSSNSRLFCIKSDFLIWEFISMTSEGSCGGLTLASC